MREECRNQEEGTPKIAMDKGRDELGDSDIIIIIGGGGGDK